MSESLSSADSSERAPPSTGLSKRDFLLGAVSGAGLFGAGRWGYSTLTRRTPSPPAATPGTVSYSQFGEDLIVHTMMETLKKPVRSYLDIGAYDPVSMNNTYFFYKHGVRGVLVEPNPDLRDKLTSARPEDTVLTAGIGTAGKRETLDYYRFNEPSWNTFSKEQADRVVRTSEGKATIREVVKATLLPINEVCQQHFAGAAPDFISIDVEGLDLEILKSLDLKKYRPAVICVEVLIIGTTIIKPEVRQYLTAHGYEHRGATYANDIFVDHQLIS